MAVPATLIERNALGIRQFGTTVSIPADPRARLMYYLDCICVVLDLRGIQNLARLRDFPNFFVLTEAEVDTLLEITYSFSPDELKGRVIFCDPEKCGDDNNNFFEISSIQSHLLVSDSILIGGQRRRVKKVMVYKPEWILSFWQIPMAHYSERLSRLANGQPTTIQYSYDIYQRPIYDSCFRFRDFGCCSCTIL